MHSLTLRESLDVPELRYNRVQLIGSEMWVTEGGIISDVQSSGSQYVVTLKLEEGDLNPFRPADILKGIYHTGTGFQTVMLRVDAVSDDGAMTVTPRYPQLLPQKFMDVARIGNFTDQRAPAQYPDLIERWPYPDPGGRRRLGRPAPDGQDDFRGHVRIHPPRIRRYVGL